MIVCRSWLHLGTCSLSRPRLHLLNTSCPRDSWPSCSHDSGQADLKTAGPALFVTADQQLPSWQLTNSCPHDSWSSCLTTGGQAGITKAYQAVLMRAGQKLTSLHLIISLPDKSLPLQSPRQLTNSCPHNSWPTATTASRIKANCAHPCCPFWAQHQTASINYSVGPSLTIPASMFVKK